MKKALSAVLIAILAITITLPSAFAVNPPENRGNDDRRGFEKFGRVAIFDSIKKENDWISTMKVTFVPSADITDVVTVSGLTEYLSVAPETEPAKLDPASLKKGDWVFVNTIFGPPSEDKKTPGKEFARMIVKPDLKALVFGIRGRELMGTVDKIDGKEVSIAPYGPHPKDKKPESRTFSIYPNMIVVKADNSGNISKLTLADVKVGSKVVASIMPYMKPGAEEKKEPQMFVVLVKVLDNFPEMPEQMILGMFDSVENDVMRVKPVKMPKVEPNPGEGGGKGEQPGPRPNDANEDPQPPERDKGPRMYELKIDSKTTFVLNTGSEIKPIGLSEIRDQDKLIVTAQLRESNDEWFTYAVTVRVVQEFPNPRTTREMHVFGTLESFGQYSVTFKPHKGENSVTLAMDPECKYIRQGEEGKRPELITISDIKPGDKLMIQFVAQRGQEERPGPGNGQKPNADIPQQRIEGTVYMIAVVSEFPKPVTMGKITEITPQKLVIEPMAVPGKNKNEEKKTMEFVINADTKFFTVTREGRKEAKIDQFKQNEWVMVEFEENEGTLTAFRIVKVDRPPNPPEGGNPNPPPGGNPKP